MVETHHFSRIFEESKKMVENHRKIGFFRKSKKTVEAHQKLGFFKYQNSWWFSTIFFDFVKIRLFGGFPPKSMVDIHHKRPTHVKLGVSNTFVLKVLIILSSKFAKTQNHYILHWNLCDVLLRACIQTVGKDSHCRLLRIGRVEIPAKRSRITSWCFMSTTSNCSFTSSSSSINISCVK